MAQGAPKGAGGGGGAQPGLDDGRGRPLSPARPAATGGQEEGKAAIFAPGTPDGQLKRHWRCLRRIRKCFNLCLAGSRPATGPLLLRGGQSRQAAPARQHGAKITAELEPAA